MTKEETMIKFNEIYADFIKENNRANYYREAMDKETAISKLREQPQFYDPQVVDTLDAIV